MVNYPGQVIAKLRLRVTCFFAVVAAVSCGLTAAFAQSSPNVVVIISDDAGYADFGFMDGLSGETSVVPTPNLDALASRGVTFSSAYTAMVCSPSRAAITTGGYQQRVGYEYNVNNLTDPNGPFEGLPVEATTIWERMKSVGYTTGAVGKWHVGSIGDSSPTQPGNRPQNQGVDEFYGMWRGSRNYNVGSITNETRVIRETTVDGLGNVTDTVVESAHNGEYITSVFGDYALQFIDDHYQDTQPFFLYQAFTAPHGPLHNSPDINDPSISGLSGNRKRYASAMLTMDKEIGRILDKLDDPDGNPATNDSITDDTMIIFINDNGGEDSISADNGDLRNYKGTPYEGGMRVPMIIAGAGVSSTVEGTVYNAPVHSVDILPTAFAAGGGSFAGGETGIDGVDLLPYINGSNTNNPHDSIVVRSSDDVGVRKGDWKLVKHGINNSFELYNLVSDIGESNNVAAANASIVEDLQRTLTDNEVEFDKPRFAQLNSNQNTINIFDHFTFRPGSGGTVPGANVLLNQGFENGTQLDGSSFYTFEELSDWSNNGDNTSPAKDETAARNDNAFAGSYRGLLSGLRTHYQVSSHSISLGEEFSISLAHSGQFSQWDVGSDSFNMELFYLDGSNNVVVLDTINVVPAGSWTTTSHTFAAITDGSAVGRPLGIRFDSLGGNSEFAGLDEIVLGLSTSSPALTLNWSAGDAWFEGGTNNAETMFHTDAFAGAVLEFPTTDDFSYVSNNDMTRSTGLEFMLNKIILSGSFAGSQNESATIAGNDVLLTDSLDGVGPQLAIDATNVGGQSYSYSVDLDLVMYDDLTITGDGDASVTINGQIKDYSAPRNLTKSGASRVSLTGNNTYFGSTTITGGTLALTGTATLANTSGIEVESGATFDLSGTSTGGLTLHSGQTLSGGGTVLGNITAESGSVVSPGSSFGQLTISGFFSPRGGSTLEFELGPGGVAGVDYDQIVVGGNLVPLGGALNVTLDVGFIPSLGDVFDILDFSNFTGSFDAINLPSLSNDLAWSLTNFATAGELLVIAAGDFNEDGSVDETDLSLWSAGYGLTSASRVDGDGNGDGIVDGQDFLIWQRTFGQSIPVLLTTASVPEPSSIMLVCVGMIAISLRRRSCTC